jgi:hypothetical protein
MGRTSLSEGRVAAPGGGTPPAIPSWLDVVSLMLVPANIQFWMFKEVRMTLLEKNKQQTTL